MLICSGPDNKISFFFKLLAKKIGAFKTKKIIFAIYSCTNDKYLIY
jgi:hypothetical protein